MSQPTSEATKPPEILPPVPALGNKNFYRRPDVEIQIARGMLLLSSDLRARAKITDETHVDFLKPESLVFFMRKADRAGDRRLRDDLFATLRLRCLGFFASQWQGFQNADREDLAQNLLKTIFMTIFAPGDRGDFFEASFWTAVKRRAVTAGARKRNRDGRCDSLDSPKSKEARDARSKVDTLKDVRLSPEQLLMLEEGLAEIPPDLRQVFVMRHYFGYAVGSDDLSKEDPADPSIATILGCSASWVRKLQKRADAALSKYRKR